MNTQDYINTFTNQEQGISLVTPSWDLFIFLFFIGAVLIFIFSLNRDRLLITILSSYLTIALINSISFLNLLYKDALPFWFWKIIIFISLVVIFSLLVSRAIGFSHFGLGSIRQIVLLSISQVGLLMSIILSFLPPEITTYLTSFTKNIFVSNLGQTIWIILPIISLIFVKRK